MLLPPFQKISLGLVWLAGIWQAQKETFFEGRQERFTVVYTLCN